MPKVATGRVRSHESVRHVHHGARKASLNGLRVGAGDKREATRREARERLEDVRERVGIRAKAPAAEVDVESGRDSGIGRGGEWRQEEVEEVERRGWDGEEKAVGGSEVVVWV